MRRLVHGIFAATLLAGQAHATVSHAVCVRPAEKAAFDIAGLKSELMVTALSCAAQDRYNAFVTRYRTSLIAEDRALNVYFGRAYGSAWRSRHDDYVTLLANTQSEQGTRLGADFCRSSVGMFDEVMALPGPRALPDYAAGKGFAQPIAVVACAVAIRRPIRHTIIHHTIIHHHTTATAAEATPPKP